KGEANVDLPPRAFQMLCSYQGVAAVMTFPGENDACRRIWKKPGDRARNARAGPIHQPFDFYTSPESGIFRLTHLRRAQNRRVQSVLRFLLCCRFLFLGPALAAFIATLLFVNGRRLLAL